MLAKYFSPGPAALPNILSIFFTFAVKSYMTNISSWQARNKSGLLWGIQLFLPMIKQKSCYTLQTVWFQLFLKPYNITHYKLCVSVLIFIYDLTILHITSDCLFLFLFQPYNITHYCQKNLKKYFSTLQNYTLLQTFCFCFFFNLTILHITVKKIWKNIFQHYKITHYFKCFLF